MKKILLFLTACLLSTGIHAQQLFTRQTNGSLPLIHSTQRIAAIPQQSLSARRALADNQYYCGYYNTDDLSQYGYGLGAYTSGLCKAATEMGSDIYGNYIGFKVVGMRIGLLANVTDLSGFIGIADNNTITEFKTTSTIDGITGWNTILFDEQEQFELPEDGTTFIVGYNYNQKSGRTTECYPVSYYEGSSVKGVLLFYANIPATVGGSGESWYSMADDGALSVQLIVEGELPDQHIILGNAATTQSFYKNDEELTWSIGVTNMGKATVSTLGFDVFIDNTKVGAVTLPADIAATQTVTVSDNLSLTDNLAPGRHTLKVELTTIDGAIPTGTVDNGISTVGFNTYINSVARQKQLIEHFTSWTCTYCYLGYKMLRQMESSNDDMAWVAIHGNQSSSADPYYFSTVDYIMNMLGANSFPSASFNRSYLPELADGDEIVYGLGYNEQYISQYAPIIYDLVKQNNTPSFVTLAIEQAYDEATSKLDITVKGTGVEKAAQLLDGYRLGIYVTEAGLSGRQYSNGKWESNFEHDNTLRAVLTNYQGTAITWDGDNFEYTTSYTIPSNYVAENLSITAFVAPAPGNLQNMAVNNCERVKVKANADGIRDINLTTGEGITARYTLDGRRTGATHRGLSIIRLADGTTLKVMK